MSYYICHSHLTNKELNGATEAGNGRYSPTPRVTREGRTAIIIAHRLATIINADAIIVIDEGRVIDYGPHHQILQRCSLYKKLYDLQFIDSSRQ